MCSNANLNLSINKRIDQYSIPFLRKADTTGEQREGGPKLRRARGGSLKTGKYSTHYQNLKFVEKKVTLKMKSFKASILAPNSQSESVIDNRPITTQNEILHRKLRVSVHGISTRSVSARAQPVNVAVSSSSRTVLRTAKSR